VERSKGVIKPLGTLFQSGKEAEETLINRKKGLHRHLRRKKTSGPQTIKREVLGEKGFKSIYLRGSPARLGPGRASHPIYPKCAGNSIIKGGGSESNGIWGSGKFLEERFLRSPCLKRKDGNIPRVNVVQGTGHCTGGGEGGVE